MCRFQGRERNSKLFFLNSSIWSHPFHWESSPFVEHLQKYKSDFLWTGEFFSCPPLIIAKDSAYAEKSSFQSGGCSHLVRSVSLRVIGLQSFDRMQTAQKYNSETYFTDFIWALMWHFATGASAQILAEFNSIHFTFVFWTVWSVVTNSTGVGWGGA